MRTVTIEVMKVLAETDLALLVLTMDSDEVWIPKSVITDADEIATGDVDIEIEVAEWWCEKEGLA